MKLNKYIWLAALPMLFTACQEDVLVENHQGLEGKFVLKASVDKEGSFSRAQIKLEEQEDGRKFGAFQWDEGDGFRLFEVTRSRDEYENEVFTVGDSHLFEISEYSNESPSTSATFVSETTPTDGTRFYAYYPSLDVNEDGETITMTLDSTLTSNSADAWKEYFNKNMYMMAEGEIRGTETELYFQHLCGLINVSYTNESSTSKYIKGISVDGKWRTSGKVYVYNSWNCIKETLDEDGYGISFTNPVEVAAGAEENFFILFMQPNGEATKMSKLSIVYSDESNSSTETKTTDSYTVGMPSFYNGHGYRLNVKETAEGKLVWAKAPVVEGFKVSTPAELIAALNGTEEKIALGADIALTSTLMVGRAVTLDLAGYKLSNVKDLTGFSAENALIVVQRGGHLTINDVSNGAGVIEPEYDGINDKPYYTIKMVGNADTGDALAKLTVNAGRINGHHTISGTKGKGKTEIIINGGDIWAGFNGGTGIVHPQEGNLLINGGEISGGRVAIEMGAGKLELNGGRVYKNKAGYDTGIALYISQGEDNKPLNVIFNENAHIECWDNQGDWNGAYAIYEEDLFNNGTDNVNIVIQGSESKTFGGITGHIYSENKKGFIGSYTAFSSPSALSYIAAGAKNVRIELESRYGDFYGPAACIPDSEEGNGAEVEVNLKGATWTIKSGDANNNYFYIGKNNSLTLLNGVVTVPEDAAGVSLIKAKDARLHFQNVTIDSYNLHYAVEIENGKVGFFRSNINAGENCYAFNIWASSLERNEPMFDLMENCEVNGNFKLGVAELPETGEQSKAPILYMGEVVAVDGDLFVSENITNDWLYYCVHYDKNSVNFAEGCTGWDSVQHATDEDLPVLPVYITDPNWIAVIENNYYTGDPYKEPFNKTDEGYIDLNDETNKSIIEGIINIQFEEESDYSHIKELQHIDRFVNLKYLSVCNTSVDNLNLSQNKSLENVYISGNKLTKLNLDSLQLLTDLTCNDEYLEVMPSTKNCSSLETLSLDMPKLSQLDLTNCTSLKSLTMSVAPIQGTLDLSAATRLEELEVWFGTFTSVNLSKNANLKTITFGGTQDLTSLDVTGCPLLSSVNIGYNSAYHSKLTSFNAENCTSLGSVQISYNDVAMNVNLGGCANLSDVWLNNCKALSVKGCTNLSSLTCSKSPELTTLDVSDCTSLINLNCQYTSLTSLDVTGLNLLETLTCDNCKLTELKGLDNGLNSLIALDCSNNQLNGINVKSLPALETLECGENNITTLDLSGLTNLSSIGYSKSSVTILNVSGCTALTSLFLQSSLKNLDISGCTNLNQLSNDGGSIKMETVKLDMTHDILFPGTNYLWGDQNSDVYKTPSHKQGYQYPEFVYPNVNN